MNQIKSRLEKSRMYFLTLPLALGLWGYVLTVSAPYNTECLYKVSGSGIIHGVDSKYFPLVIGPCHSTYSEAEEHLLRRVGR